MKDIRDKIGLKLFQLRQEKGISRKQLANQINLSVNSIMAIENGNAIPTIPNLKKYLNYFGCTLEEFFNSIEE
ncbi:helix-turn-helix domain-containing protein [Macrococcoides caseolyticum]|uniref:helix-turn-helix domain-containing protein n=1 Tax=Macrococcoides caseolyticum TaxID=69966 RepID=UPI0024BC0A49|nr:helix-turn-helix transcriptional regulator [Macrococcus caseolyticus]MDJ1087924.1 helix-turn-helix transcriptional regulator [Macrococcus caseolyticus]